MAKEKNKNKRETKEKAEGEVKRLYRSGKSRIIAGVCGGIGEYFNVDPTIVRILWILLTLLTGLIIGLIFYIALGLIIPENPEHKKRGMVTEEEKKKSKR